MNWYIVYTKPKWEKKVASTLKKRKIENFLPLQHKQISSFRKVKTQEEPLFPNYVFAKITENEFCKLKNVPGVINLVYWKGEPAKINFHEIDVIKNFTRDHENITLEKARIKINEVVSVIDGTRYSMSGNLLSIKNTIAKVTLPSVGYTLAAKIGMGIDTAETVNTFTESNLILQS